MRQETVGNHGKKLRPWRRGVLSGRGVLGTVAKHGKKLRPWRRGVLYEAGYCG
jgi:hypothetical protein